MYTLHKIKINKISFLELMPHFSGRLQWVSLYLFILSFNINRFFNGSFVVHNLESGRSFSKTQHKFPGVGASESKLK